jgi:hypothetical protein
MPSRVDWFANRVEQYTTVAPARAHARAANESAGIGAKLIRSKGTGALARDVAKVEPAGPLRSYAGSGLPYAGIENSGGIIRPRRARRLLIHGNRIGAGGRATRSTVGGSIVASADQVKHEGKHYLQAIAAAYPDRMVAALRREMPRG